MFLKYFLIRLIVLLKISSRSLRSLRVSSRSLLWLCTIPSRSLRFLRASSRSVLWPSHCFLFLFIAQVESQNVVIFAFAILGVFFLLLGLFWFGWRYGHRQSCMSPYSSMPLRRASDLSYYSTEKVLRYLYELHEYDNQMFDLRKAALCRETGRIFPNAITWFDTISVDWDFLQKRYPGRYVSWGSLTPDQRHDITERHESLEGFQTEFASKEPMPKAVEPQIAFLKPGPLYVDIDTDTLLGWKLVPGTELEVLIVQRPKPKTPIRFTPIEEEE